MTMPLWILMARLEKVEGYKTTGSAMMGYRVAATEAEARGLFMLDIEAKKPGFSIFEMLCERLPEEAMKLSLGLTS